MPTFKNDPPSDERLSNFSENLGPDPEEPALIEMEITPLEEETEEQRLLALLTTLYTNLKADLPSLIKAIHEEQSRISVLAAKLHELHSIFEKQTDDWPKNANYMQKDPQLEWYEQMIQECTRVAERHMSHLNDYEKIEQLTEIYLRTQNFYCDTQSYLQQPETVSTIYTKTVEKLQDTLKGLKISDRENRPNADQAFFKSPSKKRKDSESLEHKLEDKENKRR